MSSTYDVISDRSKQLIVIALNAAIAANEMLGQRETADEYRNVRAEVEDQL